ncbi:hypothetical protein IHE45_04G002700 [Dioscorea alata]|uniref:Uncharacterized protein n=1 Tax=Dioscorea alata TaxID=55571 RepID=A0ACB7WAN2_DIOAL|nr:hypothetical protein IHE45_04G002700 [Dioscorea alata]
MERRGGCCIVRYGSEPDVAWKMDRIMLRFRPIAPKPTVDGGVAAAAPAVPPPKTSRKRRGNPTSTAVTTKDGGGRGRKVLKKMDNLNFNLKTLALMPEMPERKEEKKMVTTYVPAAWRVGMGVGITGEVVVPRPVRPAGIVIGWGCEEEARRRAVMDTCPVFLSGPLDRVTWTNEAYRRMVVGEDDGEEEEEVRVALVTRGMVPQESMAFTCRVRVRYACRKGKGSLAAPCDVWRLGDGVLAWRLDVKAALSLSLGR